ncbi:MAG TPA: hypothetical protein VGF45_13340 [Polyangia bacterium]
MATRAETFRSEQARQRAHEAAAQRQENHGITDGIASEDEEGAMRDGNGGLLGSGHEGERGTGGRAGRRNEQRSKEAIPLTVTQMHRTFSPSARHLKRT